MAEEVGSMVVYLQGDTKQYQQSIKQAEAVTKESAAQITQDLKKTEGKAKTLGESYAFAAGKLAFVFAGVSKAVGLIQAFAGAEAQTRAFNLQLERSAKLTAELIDLGRRQFEERRGIIEATGTPQQRQAGLSRELAANQKELDRVTEELRQAATNYDRTANSKFDSLIRGINLFGLAGGRIKDLDARKAAVDNVAKKFDELRIRSRDLKILLDRALNPETDPVVIQNVNRLNFELEKQSELLGLGANSARVLEQALLGASEAQLKQSRTLAGALDLYNKGQATLQQFLTPQEQYKKTLGDLRVQLLGGAISQRTFVKAVDAAKASLDAATTSADRIDAVLAGSAEARARIIEFQTRTNFRGEGERQLAEAGTPDAQFTEGTITELEKISDILRQIRDRNENNPLRPLGL